jgi:predicted nucleic acid-binding protein
MTPPLRCVVDASVTIKLFVEEADSARAEALFNHLASEPDTRFYAPSLLCVECANILWKYVRRFGYDRKEAGRSLGRLMALSIDGIDVRDVVDDAQKIALAWDISVYDACYVATAERLGLPLITADERLVKQLSGFKPPALSLCDWDKTLKFS